MKFFFFSLADRALCISSFTFFIMFLLFASEQSSTLWLISVSCRWEESLNSHHASFFYLFVLFLLCFVFYLCVFSVALQSVALHPPSLCSKEWVRNGKQGHVSFPSKCSVMMTNIITLHITWRHPFPLQFLCVVHQTVSTTHHMCHYDMFWCVTVHSVIMVFFLQIFFCLFGWLVGWLVVVVFVV